MQQFAIPTYLSRQSSLDQSVKNRNQEQGDAMSFCARIEVWATAQGIDYWTEELKEWASNAVGWDEYSEMELMTMGLELVVVLEIHREFTETPLLKELDKCELLRWVAENHGFSWGDSIDEHVEDDDEAFTKATAYIAALYHD